MLGTDEDAAAELERSADRARARGGLAAAAAFLQHAAELTPEPADRTSRALAAAYAKHEAGASDTALELLVLASTGALDAVHAARVELLRARITFHTTRGSEGPEMLLSAARTLTHLDAPLARDTYLEAIDTALVTGGNGTPRVATAAKATPAAAVPPRPSDLLLDGLVTMFTAGYTVGAPALRRALEAFRDEADTATLLEGRSDRWLWLAGRSAVGILDDELVHVLASRHAQLARATGARRRSAGTGRRWSSQCRTRRRTRRHPPTTDLDHRTGRTRQSHDLRHTGALRTPGSAHLEGTPGCAATVILRDLVTERVITRSGSP